jgi:hypothetical protein
MPAAKGSARTPLGPKEEERKRERKREGERGRESKREDEDSTKKNIGTPMYYVGIRKLSKGLKFCI